MAESYDIGEKISRLRLIRSENVGPITFHRLIDKFKTARHALDALPDMARNGGLNRKIKITDVQAVEKELEMAEKAGAQLIHIGETVYPPRLAQIPDPPPILFVKGQVELLRKKAVAIVGARNGSLNGQRFARSLAHDLGAAGFLIVSGLARGIDAAAHRGALETGTLGVVGGGVDVIYPRENEQLYQAMYETGAVCSEVPIGVVPQARHFPKRNRIISGIARGIIVIEAGEKSGSLITARQALEQGRDVFAVPGSPVDPRVRGTNSLIRDGAFLTETAADVIDVLGAECRVGWQQHQQPASAGEPAKVNDTDRSLCRDQLLNAIGFTPILIDDVIRETKSPAAMVLATLLELEVAGKLDRLAGGYVVQTAAYEV